MSYSNINEFLDKNNLSDLKKVFENNGCTLDMLRQIKDNEIEELIKFMNINIMKKLQLRNAISKLKPKNTCILT